MAGYSQRTIGGGGSVGESVSHAVRESARAASRNLDGFTADAVNITDGLCGDGLYGVAGVVCGVVCNLYGVGLRFVRLSARILRKLRNACCATRIGLSRAPELPRIQGGRRG